MQSGIKVQIMKVMSLTKSLSSGPRKGYVEQEFAREICHMGEHLRNDVKNCVACQEPSEYGWGFKKKSGKKEGGTFPPKGKFRHKCGLVRYILKNKQPGN